MPPTLNYCSAPIDTFMLVKILHLRDIFHPAYNNECSHICYSAHINKCIDTSHPSYNTASVIHSLPLSLWLAQCNASLMSKF